MNDTTIDDDTTGDNFDSADRQLAKAGRAQIKRYNNLLDRHDKVIEDIHQIIIAFGRTLQAGRDMYGSNQHFGDWVRRCRLDTGSISRTPEERTACMKIAQLSNTGVEIEGDDDVTPARLDLTGCRDTVPTNILKWARRNQRHLFPYLRPRNATPPRPRRLMVEATLLQQVLDDPDTTLSARMRVAIERVLR